MKHNHISSNSHFLLLTGFIVLTFLGCARKPKVPCVPNAHTLQAQAESDAFFDTNPSQQPVSYLYAPGLKCTEAMMGRYCPRFTASTGENVTWRAGGHVIGQPHSSVIFSEIDLHKPNVTSWNPITKFIGKIRRDLFPLSKRCFEDQFKATVEDNPASHKSVLNYSLDFSRANVGQTWDINRLRRSYKKHIKENPGSDIVLYGDSRGAVAAFNFIAQDNPKHIKAAILEGLFDSVKHMIKHIIYIDKDKCAEHRLHKIFGVFMSGYDKHGPSPRDFVKKISDNVPLLLVISLKDSVCEPQIVIYLYKKLIERGHKNVHLLMLNNAYHPQYMIDNPQDTKLYETVVHAFYKHYSLPHNSAKAAAGKIAFDATQPSVEFLKKTYKLPECSLCS